VNPPPPPPANSAQAPDPPLSTQFAGEFDSPPVPTSAPAPQAYAAAPPDDESSDPDDYEKDPSILIENDRVILENGAQLPTNYCVKSGKPAFCVVRKALRDPRNPFTWFGGRPRIEVGLSKKHRENRLVALALTWSVFGMGVVMIIAGLVLLDGIKGGIGLFLVLISGVFRATSPIWAARVDEDYIEIRGTGQLFRDRLKAIPGAELEYQTRDEED
jgi:hypothetical protein